jgi:hypothetical protein
VGYYPVNWMTPTQAGVVPWESYPPPPGIPLQGAKSFPGTLDTQPGLVVDLNPDGFPQENGTLPRTYGESLANKPRCQQDYALKIGYMFGAALELNGAPNPLPFPLQGEHAEAWALHWNQFYAYCEYLADLQLRRILKALDDNRLTDDTIVVFLSDHGEMASAHGGMIQKWHNAYEETVRVPMVISSPLVNPDKSRMREVLQPTSTIDLAPTLLALAGCKEEDLRHEMVVLHGPSVVKPFVGADLSPHVTGEVRGPIRGPDARPRAGVFFMTNDTITDPAAEIELHPMQLAQYNRFLFNVRAGIAAGLPLVEGSVRQPNNVRAFCTGDWKIVHYVDPGSGEADEWELYCLTADPIEQTNLVDRSTGDVRPGVHVHGLTTGQLRATVKQLKRELARAEATIIG